jgi:error-prone DNA polymerase
MPGRTVLQWDKDDCAYMGLVKFDLLGLGMLGAINQVFVEIEKRFGEKWELGTIPREEPAVYDSMCRADVIGVFQIESRAQMGLLPRLKPRCFYDIAIEIAMVRPGPIQGGSVHPYIRRRTGAEPVVYDHPKLEPVLARTLGIPVFQEQLMQIAMAVGGCTAADADVIRRSIGSKRGVERLATIRDTLYRGMESNGITGATADRIYGALEAFANFGFAESHSLAFSLLVYVSTWLKVHYPADILVGLMRSQPMGFYSASTLAADAERHGVEVRVPCIVHSGFESGLEEADPEVDGVTGMDSCLLHHDGVVPPFDPHAPDETAAHRRDGNLAVRMGLSDVRGIGRSVADRIISERDAHGPFRDLHDLVRRTGLERTHLENLATAGAFDVWGLSRRDALWRAGHAAHSRAEYLAGLEMTISVPLFDDLTDFDAMVQDRWSTGVSPGRHPVQFRRTALEERGVVPVSGLAMAEPDRRLEVAGLVTHRQRPGTAKGITFLNLEDETGVVNVLCSKGLWKAYRTVARESPALIVRGILQRSPDGVTTIVADRLEPLEFAGEHRSRDFR